MPTFVELFSQQFEPEMKKTRQILAAVPDHDPAFKPHDKSMELGRLAGHIAHLPLWIARTIDRDVLELGGGDTGGYAPMGEGGRDAMLEMFERNVAESRSALAATNDAHLAGRWKLQFNGHTVVDLPRTVVLTDICLNHMIHHRGQLSVYIRLLNGKVPGLYGPSADDREAM
jgi:uncharacterized damage-inducible protein DinB